MTGAAITELFEDLKENHEFVFEVQGTEYIIQPERRNSGDFLVIYPWVEGLDCIAEQSISNNITDEDIKEILNQKCFDGSSFMDLLDEIHVIKEY